MGTATYSVSFPVKPYIRAYVQAVEGNPISFTGKSMLCLIIRAFMQNKNSTRLSQPQLRRAIGIRTDRISIIVPIQYMNSIGVSVSDDGVVLLNRWLEEVFERALHHFIQQHTKQEGRYVGYKKAYEAFAYNYGIELEKDISMDALKQMDYRFRKKKDNFFSTIVPSL